MQLVKPIFILGCHKSGTSLVRSLLDGHPDLDFVCPNELHFFLVSGYSAKYPLAANLPRPQDHVGFSANAWSLIKQSSSGQSPFAPFDIRSTLSSFVPEVFDATLRGQPAPATDRERLVRYLDAVAAAFGHDLSLHGRPVRVVEKSVSNVEFVPKLKELFPDSHFVHVIRNPYANVVAIRRARWRRGSLGKLQPFIQAIRFSLDHAVRNQSTIPDYHVMRYEDVVGDRQSVLRKLSSKLGLRYSVSMLSPTVLGNPWAGNSTSGVKFSSGINERPLREWTNEITNIECELVKRHLTDLMATWGYERVRIGRNWLLPEAGERRSAYLANRLFAYRGRGQSRSLSR